MEMVELFPVRRYRSTKTLSSVAISCRIAHSHDGCVCLQEAQNEVRRQCWHVFRFV
jgi:hypothetical protein